MKILAHIIQFINMLSDLILIGVILIMFYASFWLGCLGLLLVWHATQKTGGFFYSWKPENIKKFYKNFK